MIRASVLARGKLIRNREAMNCKHHTHPLIAGAMRERHMLLQTVLVAKFLVALGTNVLLQPEMCRHDMTIHLRLTRTLSWTPLALQYSAITLPVNDGLMCLQCQFGAERILAELALDPC